LRTYPGCIVCFYRQALETAKISGITQVISNGVDAPGTLLSLCSSDFLAVYNQAQLIISKGQGNFETLSSEEKPIFFLLMAKCPVVLKDFLRSYPTTSAVKQEHFYCLTGADSFFCRKITISLTSKPTIIKL